MERKTVKMGNPYEILGIKEDASEAEIKAAYKAMVKKYHPDRYQDNPLSDLAEEKLREVNEAYDYLMKFGSAGGSSTGGYQRSSAAPEFQRATMMFTPRMPSVFSRAARSSLCRALTLASR